MRWAGHITCIWEKRHIQGFVEKLKEWDHLVDLSIDGRRVLKWILNKLYAVDCDHVAGNHCLNCRLHNNQPAALAGN